MGNTHNNGSNNDTINEALIIDKITNNTLCNLQIQPKMYIIYQRINGITKVFILEN